MRLSDFGPQEVPILDLRRHGPWGTYYPIIRSHPGLEVGNPNKRPNNWRWDVLLYHNANGAGAAAQSLDRAANALLMYIYLPSITRSVQSRDSRFPFFYFFVALVRIRDSKRQGWQDTWVRYYYQRPFSTPGAYGPYLRKLMLMDYGSCL
ncbi:hypothetical protein E4U13_006573, partial [Claviceps humidiphila]